MSSDKNPDPANRVSQQIAEGRHSVTSATIAADPMAMMTDPFGGAAPYRTNLDDRTPEGQALVMRMINGADLRSEDVVNQTIAIRAALLQPVELMSEETGELNWCPRVVLLLDDDTTVGFVSSGVVKSLQILSRFHGRGPWDPPLAVKVKQISTRNKRRTFVLETVHGGDLGVGREAK